MGGYIYKYIGKYSGDVVYVGQSKDQCTLINRLYKHRRTATWTLNTITEFAAVPPDYDIHKAETAAINYYYIKGVMQNVSQVGAMDKDEAEELMNDMHLTWVAIDLDNILPEDNLPKPGGIVVYLERGAVMGIYIITQIIYTSSDVVYKLFSTDYCKLPLNQISYREMQDSGKYHYWTPDLFRKVSATYGWDNVDY